MYISKCGEIMLFNYFYGDDQIAQIKIYCKLLSWLNV